MVSPSSSIDLPSSYTSLKTSHIAVCHVPSSSPSPTSVILVTLNRPDKNNAFTETMSEELKSVFTLFDLDDRVKCIVLTGAGKTFCAGADLEIGFIGGTQKDGKAGRAESGKANDHRDG
jgi:enoyl-CoA hydratase/carnithine racemase